MGAFSIVHWAIFGTIALVVIALPIAAVVALVVILSRKNDK